MSQEQDADKKKPAESFADMFRAFGQAVSEILDDPELKEKAKEFTESAAESARTFGSRFKDEDAKARFRDVGTAAEDLGRSIKDSFKKGNSDIEFLHSSAMISPEESGKCRT